MIVNSLICYILKTRKIPYFVISYKFDKLLFPKLKPNLDYTYALKQKANIDFRVSLQQIMNMQGMI